MKPIHKLAVARLKELQNSDGSFNSDTSTSVTLFVSIHSQSTVFFTALILQSLNKVPETEELKLIKARAAQFLWEQKSTHYSLNYWKRESKESQMYPYPDDLDDTFLALIALQNYDEKMIDGELLAAVTRQLISVEKVPGGPYTTWLVDKDAAEVWKDVDVAVNANIYRFLKSQKVKSPRLEEFLQHSLTTEALVSRYYHSPVILLYYLAQCGIAPDTVKKALFALQQPGKGWRNAQDTALAISALRACGVAEKELPFNFLNMFQWQAQALCLDPSENHQRRFAGSEAATIALCLEALLPLPLRVTKESSLSNFREVVVARATQRFAQLAPGLKVPLESFTSKMAALDTKIPILTLPALVAQVLEVSFEPEDLLNLGLANLYGWIAYSIADDFLDNEGDPHILPAGNWAMREMRSLFAHSGGHDFQAQVNAILDALDGANAWEQENLRFAMSPTHLKISLENLPDFGNLKMLAERSSGHALAALAILHAQGYSSETKANKALLKFFHHFLIARQLHDDAHDWREDLRQGQLTAVNTRLLKDYAKLHSFEEIDKTWAEIVPELRELFWSNTIEGILDEIASQVKMAEKALLECVPLKKPEAFLKMVEPLKSSAQSVKNERNITLKFLESYQK